MEKLYKDVQRRLEYVYGETQEEPAKESELKVFTMRLSLELLEQLDHIASVMQLSRTEVARMILTHGVEGIVEEFKITTGETVGMTFAQKYEFENAPDDEKMALIEKWKKEAEEKKEGN